MRRTGKTLQWLAVIPILIAGVLLVRQATDDDSVGVNDAAAPATTTTTVPFNVGNSDVDTDAPAGEVLEDLADDAQIDTGPGIAPGTNSIPVVFAPPDGSYAEGESRIPVPNVQVDDVEARAGGAIGVLVVSPSAGLHMELPAGVNTIAEQGWGWFPMIGTLRDINAALATMQLEPLPDRRELRVTVTITDFGHGDEDQAEVARGSFSYYRT